MERRKHLPSLDSLAIQRGEARPVVMVEENMAKPLSKRVAFGVFFRQGLMVGEFTYPYSMHFPIPIL